MSRVVHCKKEKCNGDVLIELANTTDYDIQKLWDKIKHGDEDHRKWLKKELEEFFKCELKD